eukprot:Gb_07728 [translate_table: standard]
MLFKRKVWVKKTQRIPIIEKVIVGEDFYPRSFEDPILESERNLEGSEETPTEGAVMEGFSLNNAPSRDSVTMDVSHMNIAQKLVEEGGLDIRKHCVENETMRIL